MIKADKLEYTTIMNALERGDFYASNGPAINELTLEDGVLHIECSEAVRIVVGTERRITLAANVSANEPAITSKDFIIDRWLKETADLPEELKSRAYMMVTTTDKAGKHAWSRPYFYSDLIKAQ